MKSAISTLLALAAVVNGFPAQRRIEPDWEFVGSANGSSYYRDNSNETIEWLGAQWYCKDAGMELAAVTTSEQLAIIRKAAQPRALWTAARDANIHEQFIWDGTSIHPDSSIVSNYIHMGTYISCLEFAGERFYDTICKAKNRIFCQTRNASHVPTSGQAHDQYPLMSETTDNIIVSNEVPSQLNMTFLGSADGKDYYLDNSAMRDWYNAKATCESVDMKLGSILTDAQNVVLTAASANATSMWWTSGRDSHYWSQWVWDTNQEDSLYGAIWQMAFIKLVYSTLTIITTLAHVSALLTRSVKNNLNFADAVYL